MERVLISTPDGQISDNDDTGTTSMISSLLGTQTPGFEPRLHDIEELDSSYNSNESPGFLQAYSGPGKLIDPNFTSIDFRINAQDAKPIASKIKTVFYSIEKLKTSSHQSLKGSIGQINKQANTAIGQVLDALHSQDQTMKSLKDALNDIDIVTEKSNMNIGSQAKIDNLKQVRKSYRELKKEERPGITKEWVQNEVEIQIDYLKKTLNIEQIQNVLNHMNKERLEEKDYKSQLQDLIRNEVYDHFKNSDQNLSILDQVQDFVFSSNEELKQQIQCELTDRFKDLLQQETKKVMSETQYVTESQLKKTLQDALMESRQNTLKVMEESSNTKSEFTTHLEERFESLQKQMDDVKLQDIFQRISKLEESISASKDINDLKVLKQTLYEKVNGQTNDFKFLKDEYENNQNKITQRFSNLESIVKKLELHIPTNDAENDNRISSLEENLKGMVTAIYELSAKLDTLDGQKVQNPEPSNISNSQTVIDQMSSRILSLELEIKEVANGLRKISSQMPSTSEKNNLLLENIQSRVDELEKLKTMQLGELREVKSNLAQVSELRREIDNNHSALKRAVKDIEVNLQIINDSKTEESSIINMSDSQRRYPLNSNGTSPTKENLVDYRTLEEAIKKLEIELSYQKQAVELLEKKNSDNDTIELIDKKISCAMHKIENLETSQTSITKQISMQEDLIVKKSINETQKKLEEAVFSSINWKKIQDQISHLSESINRSAFRESDFLDLDSLNKEVESLKIELKKSESSGKRNQVQQSMLDMNTRLSVLATRISDVETVAKSITNYNDLPKDLNDLKGSIAALENAVKVLDEKLMSSTKNEALNAGKSNELSIDMESLQSKIINLESFIKTNIDPALKKAESDYSYQGETLRTMQNTLRSLQEEKSSAQIETWISSHLSKFREEFESKFENKVDNDVLEELVKHLATRDELRKVAKKKQMNFNENRKSNILQETDQNRIDDQLYIKIKKDYEKYLSDQINSLENRLRSVEVNYKSYHDPTESELGRKEMKSFKTYTENLIDDKMKHLINSQKSERARKEGTVPTDDEIEFLEQRMRREFDEKLFLICSDISSCKTMLASQLYEPFHRCAQWIWKSGRLKLGSAVPWNIQTRNTGKNNDFIVLDEENFIWEQDSFKIKVAEAGLYEITMAFFTKTKPSIQLVVNGESVMSAINSPSYVVHHSSGYIIDGNGRMEEGTVSGLSLVDFLALPSKSTLSIHYHGVKKHSPGHGFLSLRKL